MVFHCRDESSKRAKVQWTRPAGRPLPPGSVDNNGRLEIPNIRVRFEKIHSSRNIPV